MPIVQVQMLRGRSPEQKRRLIAELTRVMADVVGASPERVNVVILEVDRESWGRGGVPLPDGRVTSEAETHAGG